MKYNRPICLFAAILLLFIAHGCKWAVSKTSNSTAKEVSQTEGPKPLEIRFSENIELNNPQVLAVIKEYIRYCKAKTNRGQVFVLMLHQEDHHYSFKISSFVSLGMFKEWPPLGYFLVDEEVVLIYFGLEGMVNQPSPRFMESLQEIIGDRLFNDIIEEGGREINLHQHTHAWSVSVFRDSISVEKEGVVPPFTPKMSTLTNEELERLLKKTK